MDVLDFTVLKKNIECDTRQVVGDNDYQASFMLDEEWDDKEVICRVVWNNTTSLDIKLEDLSCVIPAYIMKRGEVSIGVYVDGDEQLTTSQWKIGVTKSIREKEFETAVPHKAVWDGINEKVKDVVTHGEFDEQVGARVNAYLGEKGVITKTDLALEGVYENINLEVDTTGYYYNRNTNELIEASWCKAMKMLSVAEGEQFKISGRSSYGCVLFNILDVNNAVIESYPATSGAKTDHVDYIFTIPGNGAYLACNNNYTSNPTTLTKYNPSDVVTEVNALIEKQKAINGDSKNPLEIIKQDGGMLSIFDSITCIGDSLTAGCFEHTETGSTVWTTIEKYSYPANLAKMTGCKVQNYGRSGRTALDGDNSWLSWADSQGWLTADDKTDAYIIALGTNDIGVEGGFTGDVATDIAENYADNAVTSVGGYDKIIRRILERQPKAKIFCVCLPHTRNTEATIAVANTAIKAIAELYPDNCYVLDLETYYVQRTEVGAYKAKYYNGGHRNAMGYKELANVYATYIDWIIRNNIADFVNVQFVETDYAWT